LDLGHNMLVILGVLNQPPHRGRNAAVSPDQSEMWGSGSLQVTQRPQHCLFDRSGTSHITNISRYTVSEAGTVFRWLHFPKVLIFW